MTAKKILIADDDIKLATALSVRLEAVGFEVVVCQDAYQALDLSRRHRPDLLVLDINMPAGDGFSVQERLRGIDELSTVPVIFMTGTPRGAVDIDARKSGAFAVVHKPFSAQVLIDAICAALENEKYKDLESSHA